MSEFTPHSDEQLYRLFIEEEVAAPSDCLEPVPLQVIEAAKSLVKPAQIESRDLGRMRIALHPLAAAAVLGICALGYATGVGFKDDSLSSDQLANEMSFGVFETLEDDDHEYDLLALLIKENSQ